MKKNKLKNKIKPKVSTTARQSPPKPPSPPLPLTGWWNRVRKSAHRLSKKILWLWPIFRKLAVWFFALLGLAATVDQIWGPQWPLPPSFAPQSYSSALPLDAPFEVSNKSERFPIQNLQITCTIISMVTTYHQIFGPNVSGSVQGFDNLNRGESRPYTCALGELLGFPADDTIVSAQIQFDSRYDRQWASGRVDIKSPIFSLDTKTAPPVWLEGAPIQAVPW